MSGNIKWLVQKNLTEPKILNQLQQAIVDSGVTYEEITVIPFSDELDYKGKCEQTNLVVYGSTSLMLGAYRNDYLRQGVFYHPDCFHMKNYVKYWGAKMLNADGMIMPISEFIEMDFDPHGNWFIRPNEDTKSFSGMVVSFAKFKEIANYIVDENPQIQSTSLILASKPKAIEKEWRNFIVEGKVVSTARYCVDGKVNISVDDIPTDMIVFSEECCKEYTPHDVFVMDIGLSEGSYKIIECNCFNGTGFYDHDIKEIVKHVNWYLKLDRERQKI